MSIGDQFDHMVDVARDLVRQVSPSARPFLFIVPVLMLILIVAWPLHRKVEQPQEPPKPAAVMPAIPPANEASIRAGIESHEKFTEPQLIDVPRHFTLGEADFFKQYPVARYLADERIIQLRLLDWGNRIECDIAITEKGRSTLGDALDETQPAWRLVTARRVLAGVSPRNGNQADFQWYWKKLPWFRGDVGINQMTGTAYLETSGDEWRVTDIRLDVR